MHVGYLNLRNYGGGPRRFGAFCNALTVIKGVLPPSGTGAPPPAVFSQSNVAVVGFSELRSNSPATLRNIELMTTAWTGSITPACVIVQAGVTAKGQTEYIALGVHDQLQLVGYGRICLNAAKRPPTMDDSYKKIKAGSGFPLQPEQGLARFPSADTRGVVYVVVTDGTRQWAVGFVHNVLTLNQKEEFLNKIPDMMATLRKRSGAKLANAANGFPILGGDWNARPASRGGERQAAFWVPATANMAPLMIANPRMGTTWGGNPFDYWYTGLGNDQPLAHSEPMAQVPVAGFPGGVVTAYPTDHAAITIQI
jgi:hypothetical protein